MKTITDLERVAFNRIELASSVSLSRFKKPLVVAYSGGKDSDVLVELTRRSGVPFTVEHHLTTVDAPETIYHVRSLFKRLEDEGIKCSFNTPVYKGIRTTVWALIPQKGMPPTRLQRYCCSVLKEQGGRDTMVMTGVRWDESHKRKTNRGIYETYTPRYRDKMILLNDNEENRDMMETCKIKGKMITNPIVDWTDSEIWQYIHAEKIPMNPLYQNGFRRVGCIGCPMAGKKRWTEFRLYPTYERAYRRAFDVMLQERLRKRPDAPTNWHASDDVFRWWMEDKNLDGQISFEEYLDNDFEEMW